MSDLAISDLDGRLHAFRPDLADARLRGRVSAARFTEGRPARVTAGLAGLHPSPDRHEALDTQLLFGERVTVFDETAEWAWVQNEADGYVGYMRTGDLSGETLQATHRIRGLSAHVMPEPALKHPPMMALPMGALVTAEGSEGAYSRLATGGWIYSRQLQALDDPLPDFVATALDLTGVPYLWGGRSALGLDCSALVQLVLSFAGIAAPRDSDQQEAGLGEPLDWVEGETLPERGDLLYGEGHVAIALDGEGVINANAYSMSVLVEPRADIAGRLVAESGQGFRSRRRVVPQS